MLWGCLVGLGIALLLLPFVAIGQLIFYAIRGGPPKQVRCPACTQRQTVDRNQVDYDCKACGTPILRGGEFVKRETQ